MLGTTCMYDNFLDDILHIIHIKSQIHMNVHCKLHFTEAKSMSQHLQSTVSARHLDITSSRIWHESCMKKRNFALHWELGTGIRDPAVLQAPEVTD